MGLMHCGTYAIGLLNYQKRERVIPLLNGSDLTYFRNEKYKIQSLWIFKVSVDFLQRALMCSFLVVTTGTMTLIRDKMAATPLRSTVT